MNSVDIGQSLAKQYPREASFDQELQTVSSSRSSTGMAMNQREMDTAKVGRKSRQQAVL